MSRFNVIGVNDEKDFCECCGKQNLKRVVWVEDTETQEVKHFGTSCAISPIKGFGKDKEIKKAICEFESKQQYIRRKAFQIYRSLGGALSGNGADGWKFVDAQLHSACLSKAKGAA